MSEVVVGIDISAILCLVDSVDQRREATTPHFPCTDALQAQHPQHHSTWTPAARSLLYTSVGISSWHRKEIRVPESFQEGVLFHDASSRLTQRRATRTESLQLAPLLPLRITTARVMGETRRLHLPYARREIHSGIGRQPPAARTPLIRLVRALRRNLTFCPSQPYA
jgi:hypothetical protein